MVRILKSMPMVVMKDGVKESSLNRSKQQDLPTPESPISNSLIYRRNVVSVSRNSWKRHMTGPQGQAWPGRTTCRPWTVQRGDDEQMRQAKPSGQEMRSAYQEVVVTIVRHCGRLRAVKRLVEEVR
jgi:hypothetical protein